MKKRILLFLFTLLVVVIARAATTDEMLTVAVFDFEAKEDAVEGLGPKVATLLTANLSSEPTLITVERAELEKILGEHELSLSGNVSADSAIKVGQLTGAKVLVTGKVFKADKDLFLVAKIISTETSRVYGELIQGPATASVADLSAQLAKKISATVTAKGETLVAKVVTREERIARIKKSLEGKKLASVQINIPEQHYGTPVHDPAAETEMGLVLRESGFTLLDGKSVEKPEVEIVGEAFSAYGLRKGNLISCKARVEIKVREKATGRVIATDHQTSMSADVAEQTAAKTALGIAAGQLAERIALKLAK